MSDQTNPKDLQGAKKIDLSLVPAIAVSYCAHAMMDGAWKYGPYNWRDKHVQARVYIAAARRHLDNWEAGEELTDDSFVHNLGCVMACCAILLDAQLNHNLIDNRPKSPLFLEAVRRLNAAVKKRSELEAQKAAQAAESVANSKETV